MYTVLLCKQRHHTPPRHTATCASQMVSSSMARWYGLFSLAGLLRASGCWQRDRDDAIAKTATISTSVAAIHITTTSRITRGQRRHLPLRWRTERRGPHGAAEQVRRPQHVRSSVHGLRCEWYLAFRSPLLLQQRTERGDLCVAALQLVAEHGRFRLR